MTPCITPSAATRVPSFMRRMQSMIMIMIMTMQSMIMTTPNPETVTSGLLNRFSGTQGAGSAPVDPEPLEGPQNGTETGGGLA